MAGSRLRRVVLLGGVLVLLALVGAALWVRDLQTAANVAQLVGVVLAVPAVALLLWELRSPRARPIDLAQVKKDLAGRVREQWLDEVELRRLDERFSMPVRWGLVTDPRYVDDPANAGATTFAGPSGDVVEWFRSLRRRRLVIVGGAGSGKTTLAVQLLSALLDVRTGDDPVPVWISLTDWGADRQPHKDAPGLREWLATRLQRDARVDRDAARQLVDSGGIVPILDGLDEIPEHSRIEIIAALNRSASIPMILISRTEEYIRAVLQGRDVLTAAAVIEAEPLTPVVAVDYLRASLRPGPVPAWDKVLTALRSATLPVALAGGRVDSAGAVAAA